MALLERTPSAYEGASSDRHHYEESTNAATGPTCLAVELDLTRFDGHVVYAARAI